MYATPEAELETAKSLSTHAATLNRDPAAEKDLSTIPQGHQNWKGFFHCFITKLRLGENCDDAWKKSWLGRLQKGLLKEIKAGRD